MHTHSIHTAYIHMHMHMRMSACAAPTLVAVPPRALVPQLNSADKKHKKSLKKAAALREVTEKEKTQRAEELAHASQQVSDITAARDASVASVNLLQTTVVHLQAVQEEVVAANARMAHAINDANEEVEAAKEDARAATETLAAQRASRGAMGAFFGR